MKEKVIITQGKYIASAVRADQYPETKMKEIVFMGRSNVGKSSLINSLTRVRGLARVSRQPGKTQTINFYELGAKIEGIEDRRDFYLVDLPGYGYAKTGKENRKRWAKFIDEYLVKSPQLQFVCQLVDSRHATVTICHSRTKNLAKITRQADILVVAIGRPNFVTADMVKPGAAVIDVGINRIAPKKLTGDVDFSAVEAVAGAITPVPGGVGLLTIAMLMENTITAATLQLAGK